MLVTLLAGTPLAAQEAPPSPAPALPGGGPNGQPPATIMAEPVAMMIAACDSNGDARVSHAELVSCVQRSFASVDRGGSGSIGYIDYSDWALLWLGDRNALPSPFTIDTNGDNRITLTELQVQFDSLFGRFDVDKDGSVTRAELLTIKSGFSGDRVPRGKRRR